jgi:hypothetical protein
MLELRHASTRARLAGVGVVLVLAARVSERGEFPRASVRDRKIILARMKLARREQLRRCARAHTPPTCNSARDLW